MGVFGVDADAMESTKLWFAELLDASVTCATNENCPVCDVDPLNCPALLKPKPEGKDPDATDHRYGVVPPLAESEEEYELPACAPGTEVVVIARVLGVGVDAALTETLALAFFVESAALVAVMVTLVLVETLGAVNIPADEIEPALAAQLTDVLVVPWTLAANCCVLPEPILADAGDTETLTLVVAGSTVIAALATLVGSALLVARTVTFIALLTLGAVNFPPSVIDPALVDQVTPVLLVPWTLAVNCWPAPEVIVVEDGDTATLTLEPAVIETVALAIFVASAALVARTVTVVAAVTLGAVKLPVLVIDPALADQVTPVLLVPWTLAENCCVAPDAMVALVGETEMLTFEPVAGATAMWMRSLAVSPCWSVTLTHAYLRTATVGVPVTAPVLALRDSPEGRAPSATEKTYGVVPPLAMMFPE